jgi:hypothetical protein
MSIWPHYPDGNDPFIRIQDLRKFRQGLVLPRGSGVVEKSTYEYWSAKFGYIAPGTIPKMNVPPGHSLPPYAEAFIDRWQKLPSNALAEDHEP